VEKGSAVTLSVPPALLSQMIGQHRRNLEQLMRDFSLSDLRVRPGSGKNGEIRVLSVKYISSDRRMC
jgi:hypothetical protein